MKSHRSSSQLVWAVRYNLHQVMFLMTRKQLFGGLGAGAEGYSPNAYSPDISRTMILNPLP